MRDWLKELRTQSSMTQTELAKELAISRTYYSRIENGKRKKCIDLNMLHRLSEVFNIPNDLVIQSETAYCNAFNPRLQWRYHIEN